MSYIDGVSALKEYVIVVAQNAVENGQAAIDTVKAFLLGDSYDETTETVYFPAYARGIGSVFISGSAGQTLTDGTIYFPSQSATGETVIFSAGSSSGVVQYRNVISSPDVKGFAFSRSGSSYYYHPQQNVLGDRIRIFWQDTYTEKELNGVYVLTGSYPGAFPANINAATNNYMCRLKYWTFNSYKRTSVDNSLGLNVPSEYHNTWNINIPVGGDSVTYGDVVQQVITNYNNYVTNNNIQEETLDPSDPPPEYDWDNVVEEVFPDAVDPTEPGGGEGFTFDYSQVISPPELRHILEQETYEVETIDDRGVLSLEVPTLPDATFSSDGLSVVVDSVTAGKGLLSSWGLWVPFVACAVVAVLFRFLR